MKINPIDYLEKLRTELLAIDLESYGETEYVEFEAIQKKTAMCFENLFGADSVQVSRVYNIVSGERYLRASKEKREERFFRAIQDLASEIEVAIDSQKIAAHALEAAKADVPTIESAGFENLLHPIIVKSSLHHYESRHFRDAVLNGVTAIFDLIRLRTGLQHDGSGLVSQAFGIENGKLIFSEIDSESGQSDQKGFLKILDGTYVGVRNPKAHTLANDLDQIKDAQYLVFLSLLARRVSDAKLRPKKD